MPSSLNLSKSKNFLSKSRSLEKFCSKINILIIGYFLCDIRKGRKILKFYSRTCRDAVRSINFIAYFLLVSSFVFGSC